MRIGPVVIGDYDDPAEECADYYWHNCDGHEDKWPLIFVMYNEDNGGPEIQRREVEMEMCPQFCSWKVEGHE
jgi:hypothetical protein